jgi:hypothetical protein
VLFAQRQKPAVVRAANRFALVGLALLCLALTAVLLLVSDVLLARGEALAVAAVFGLGTATLWTLPAWLKRRGG